MIGKITHIGIAVRDLAQVRALYGDVFGLTVSEEEQNDHFRWVFVPLGTTSLEFIESRHDRTAISRFIEDRGEGIHHVALEVDNIEASLRALREKGVPLIDEEPKGGAHNSRIAFIHPKGTQGVLIELVQPAKATTA